MKQIKENVEQLKLCLLQRKNTKVRFRIPMSEEIIYDYLLASNMAEVEYRHRLFVDNDEVHSQLSQMAHWSSSRNSKFGMILCGGCGNGKSTMLKAFQQLLNFLNLPAPYGQGYYGIQIVDAKYIAHLCKTDYSAFLKLASKDMLGIDDLGTEAKEIMDFGNVFTPIIDLLTKRYEEQLFTIITTNLTPLQIREHYGDRIADRLNEMVDKIIYKNSTYRTN